MKNRWTAEEDALLLELSGHLLRREVAALLGRPYGIVTLRAEFLGLGRKPPRISADEIRLVSELMDLMPYPAIGNLIGRSAVAVEKIAKRHVGKRRPPRGRVWTADEDAALRAVYPMHPNTDIALVFDRSRKAVEHAATRLQLKKLPPTRWRPLVPPALRDAIAMTKELKEKIREREQRENDRGPARRAVSATRRSRRHLETS